MNASDKRFLEKVRFKLVKAVEDYKLIEPNDKILVALSGGKDSVVLLDALHNKKKYFSFDYTLEALTIELPDVGYLIEKEKIQTFCRERNIENHFISDPVKIVNGKKHPCFYCAWNRRKLLFDFAIRNGFNKVAFGHNRDDVVETLLMNMVYHAEFSAFPAKLTMFGGKTEIIRPLIYVANAEAQRYVDLIDYEPVPYNCPFARENDREKFRHLLSMLHEIHPHAAENIFKSLQNMNREYLPVKPL